MWVDVGVRMIRASAHMHVHKNTCMRIFKNSLLIVYKSGTYTYWNYSSCLNAKNMRRTCWLYVSVTLKIIDTLAAGMERDIIIVYFGDKLLSFFI